MVAVATEPKGGVTPGPPLPPCGSTATAAGAQGNVAFVPADTFGAVAGIVAAAGCDPAFGGVTTVAL